MTTATPWTLARRWGWLIALATLIGAGTAVALSGIIPSTYRATATVLVTPETAGPLRQADLAASEELAGTLSQLVTIRPVLDRVAALEGIGLSAGQIGDRIEAAQVGGSLLITISAVDGDPARASNLANLVAQTFIASPETSLGQDPLSVSIIEPAEVPSQPVAPDTRLNGLLGALLGFASSVGLVVLYQRLDRTITGPEEVYRLTGLPTLARLSDAGRRYQTAGPLVSASATGTPLAEEYRHARTNLKRALLADEQDRMERRVVAVTSPGDVEGRTSVAAGLAVVFGLSGHRTLVIDADLRRPTLHDVFGVGATDGLASLLTSERGSLASAVRQTSNRGVWLLAAGHAEALGGSRHPADLLESPRLRELLQVAGDEFDLVLIDTPAALRASEAAIVASAADAVLLVARAHRTTADELSEATERLSVAPCPIVGVILNRTRGASSLDAVSFQEARPTVLPLPPASGPGRRDPAGLEAARPVRDREAAP